MNTVRDIMMDITSYPTISKDESVATVLGGLRDVSVSPWFGNKTIVAVDDNNNAVGLITIKSLLRAIDLKDPNMEMQLQDETWSGYFTWQRQQWADLPVSEIMRPLSAGVGSSMSLKDAAMRFLERDVNTMSVVENGKVVGLVNVYHLCAHFAKHL